jgi:hypothetical protein
MNEELKRGLRAGYYWRLLPRHGVHLFAPCEGGERFARLFIETWKRLPYLARRRILGHWKKGPLGIGPRIHLLPDWSGRRSRVDPDGALATTGLLGLELFFCAEAVAAYPDELVRGIVAHELAHVLQWASGCDMVGVDAEEWEMDADELVEDWGFSATAMDEWDLYHVPEEPAPDPVFDAQVAAIQARLDERASHLGINRPVHGAGHETATG